MRIGQIGLGRWGSRVSPNYRQLLDEKKIDEYHVYDINQGKTDFNSFDDFLDNVDGVHIAVPNDKHYEVTKAVLENDKHVLIEKPMTLVSDEAYELIEIAAERGLVLQVGYILRFSNVLQKAKEIIASGKIGNIMDCRMEWTTLMPPMHGADIIWDLLPHPLDIMYFITGKFPKDWYVLKRPVRRPVHAEIASILFRYETDHNTFFADTKLSWITPHKRRVVELVGDHGMKMSIECVEQKIDLYKNRDDVQNIPVKSNDTIYAEALNFVECIKDGKNRFNSHIIGARNTSIIENLMRSCNG